ncbi:MAG: glycosyl hydrolase family 2, partial [Bacteroidia bacterium]|nr:glycosyl hydrolase family 2 [Bacteroidia bacterium]
MKLSALFFFSFLTLISCQNSSNLELPSLIGDNMLLQQKTNAKIWGKAIPGHKISVSSSWNASGQTTTGKDGKWIMNLSTPEAGGPYTITISGRDTSIVIKNVLIGEVWFCSGQSNMEMPLAGWPPVDTIMYSAKTISSASIPEIRLFNVQKKIAGEPIDDCTGRWEVSTPETVQQFSATAYFFGKKLHDELHIPIGLIESAWGGTPAESWISSTALENGGEFISDIKEIKESAPLQAEYQSWLNSLKQLEPKPGGNDQWKDLSFNDENVPSPEFNDNDWPVMALPSQFEKVIGEFDGAVWFRKKVEIPKSMTGKDLVLSLGPIDDMDRTYFNGKLIGSNEVGGVWQVDRNYEIPASLVKDGANTVSVRVLDTQGGGGIYGAPDKMKLSLKNDIKVSLPLNGDWKYQSVAEVTGNRFYIFDISKNEFLSRKRPKALGPNTPTVLYNAMVNPVLPFQIKGAIWYQGESNVGRAEQYAKIFPIMIQNWREAWGIKDFPFYFVQIAPYVYSGIDSTESAYLREAQEKTLKLANTGMVTTFDITTVMNIHPPFKKEVGERLALLALNTGYGIKNPCVGPVYKSMSVAASTIKLQFDNVGDGLMAKNNNLNEFEVAGKDGKYVKAKAKIVNNEVLVFSSSVPEPVS